MKKGKAKIAAMILAVFVCSFALSIVALAEEAKTPPINVGLELKSKSAILVDAHTGKVLYENNADEQLKPASVTKVMTILLIVEAINSEKIGLDDMVSVSDAAAKMGGSQIYLKAGEMMSVHDLLKSIVVSSANDAAMAMGEFIAGSNEAFIAMMNQRAKGLGMKNTNFINSNGLDVDGHYTSARDIAIMSQELLKHEMIKEYTTIWMDTVRDGKFTLSNTNKLIKTYNGVTGLKTGSTSQALYCMSASAERQGVSLIAVVMAAPTGAERFAEAAKLLDHGFANYSNVTKTIQEETFDQIPVINGEEDIVSVEMQSDVSILLKKGTEGEVRRQVELPESVTAPVEKGQHLGRVTYYIGEEKLATSSIVAGVSVKKITFIYSLRNLLEYALMMKS